MLDQHSGGSVVARAFQTKNCQRPIHDTCIANRALRAYHWNSPRTMPRDAPCPIARPDWPLGPCPPVTAARAPRLLLTRPRDSAQADAGALRALGWHGQIVIAPLQDITLRAVAPEVIRQARSLVATSQHAIAVLAQAGAARDVALWCVGPRTLAAAQAAGFTHLRGGTGADAEALLAQLLAEGTEDPIVHVHGDHLAIDLAARLRAAGHDARGVAGYGQQALALSDAGRACLMAAGDVVVPLYSPRSARLFAAAHGLLVQPQARLHLIALSPNVAACTADMGAASRLTLPRPDADAMLQAQISLQGALEAAGKPR